MKSGRQRSEVVRSRVVPSGACSSRPVKFFTRVYDSSLELLAGVRIDRRSRSNRRPQRSVEACRAKRTASLVGPRPGRQVRTWKVILLGGRQDGDGRRGGEVHEVQQEMTRLGLQQVHGALQLRVEDLLLLDIEDATEALQAGLAQQQRCVAGDDGHREAAVVPADSDRNPDHLMFLMFRSRLPWSSVV